jgi:hypothetical protein
MKTKRRAKATLPMSRRVMAATAESGESIMSMRALPRRDEFAGQDAAADTEVKKAEENKNNKDAKDGIYGAAEA